MSEGMCSRLGRAATTGSASEGGENMLESPAGEQERTKNGGRQPPVR
jgi:hypothetical protein